MVLGSYFQGLPLPDMRAADEYADGILEKGRHKGEPAGQMRVLRHADGGKRTAMVIEILELAAALEWIALGVLVFSKLRSANKRLNKALDELEDAVR